MEHMNVCKAEGGYLVTVYSGMALNRQIVCPTDIDVLNAVADFMGSTYKAVERSKEE